MESNNTLYNIIKAVQINYCSIDKMDILYNNKNNSLLKAYLKAVYDPTIVYSPLWVDEISKWKISTGNLFTTLWVNTLIDEIIKNNAAETTEGNSFLYQCSTKDKLSMALVELLLNRSIDKAITRTMILEVFPDLFFIPTYQRVGKMTEGGRELLSTQEKGLYLQQIPDGVLVYACKALDGTCKLISKEGSHYPSWLAEKLTKSVPIGYVVIGHIKISNTKGNLLNDKLIEYLLRKILRQKKTEKDCVSYHFDITFSDILKTKEFENGNSNFTFENRFLELKKLIPNFQIVPVQRVKSILKAQLINSELISRENKGCTIRTADSIWCNGKAKDVFKF